MSYIPLIGKFNICFNEMYYSMITVCADVVILLPRECKCFLGIPDVAREIQNGNLKYVKDHERFIVNCHNRHVLEYFILSILMTMDPWAMMNLFLSMLFSVRLVRFNK